MARRLFDQLINWVNGVINSANPDSLPPSASPRGVNSAFYNIGLDHADIGNRMGATLVNATPLTASPAIIGQYEFRKSNGTKYHLLFGGNGHVWRRTTDTAVTLLDSTTFTSGAERIPEFAPANDLLFIANGINQAKFNGTTFTNFGIVRPAAPTAGLHADASAVGMSGEYDIAISYYNSATQHESSRSNSVLVNNATGKKLSVSWTLPADAQVTHVFVHIRKRTLGSLFYKLIVGMTPAPDAGTGGFAPATLATVIDVADSAWQSFITQSPGTDTNEPPPADARYPTWHKNRMFVIDRGTLYWSKVEEPEAFDLENSKEPINPDDGDEATGLHSAPDALLIFKRKRVYGLFGDDPSNFELVLLSADIGCESHRSILTARNVTTWWSSLGPVARPMGGTIDFIGQDFISETIQPTVLNVEKLHLIQAVNDEDRQRILFTVPEAGLTRNTAILPWNYRKNRWESTAWNPFDVASFAYATDSESKRFVYLGNYSGQLFKFWVGFTDGVASGTQAGSVVSATNNTLTDTGAAFDTVGGGLIERYVYAISKDFSLVQRRRITANTATQLTVTPNWEVNPNNTYTYKVGAIDFQWDTPWVDSGAAFRKKRYEFLFAQMSTKDANITVRLDCFFTYDNQTVQKQRSFVLGSAAVYAGPSETGPAFYDTARYAAASTLNVKLRMGKTGHAWRTRIRVIESNKEVVVNKIAMQSVLMNEKDIAA